MKSIPHSPLFRKSLKARRSTHELACSMLFHIAWNNSWKKKREGDEWEARSLAHSHVKKRVFERALKTLTLVFTHSCAQCLRNTVTRRLGDPSRFPTLSASCSRLEICRVIVSLWQEPSLQDVWKQSRHKCPISGLLSYHVSLNNCTGAYLLIFRHRKSISYRLHCLIWFRKPIPAKYKKISE